MEVKHKNLKEDFKLLISLGENYGGEEFRLTFTSGKLSQKQYVCSWDGTDYVNCEMADDTHVLCKFDNHGLGYGLVYCDAKVCLPDTSMADGSFALDSKALVEFLVDNVTYHLELTDGKSDIIETVEATFELLGTVLKGDDGLTTQVKVNGTTHTQVDGLIDLGTIGDGMEDAPKDGNTYARKDGEWEAITESEGKVKDVTVDGSSVLDEETGTAAIDLTGKADKSTVDTLQGTVALKADQTTVAALTTVVGGKADTSTVNALTQTVNNKEDYPTVQAAMWSSYPEDNHTYNLGVVSAIVLSENDKSCSTCPNGTLIYFTCPDDAGTTITYKDNTEWAGTTAPVVSVSNSYVIAIIDGRYSLTQITKQTIA